MFEYKYSIFVFLLVIILFYPFGENLRGVYDIRGLFTPFAIFPQYESIDKLTYFIFSLITFGTLLSMIFSLFKLTKNNSNLQIYKINPFINIYSILFVVVFLILTNQLQINTMRHLLFIIPFLFFISNHSFQTLFEIFLFRKNFLKKFSNIGFLLI